MKDVNDVLNLEQCTNLAEAYVKVKNELVLGDTETPCLTLSPGTWKVNGIEFIGIGFTVLTNYLPNTTRIEVKKKDGTFKDVKDLPKFTEQPAS